MKTEGTVSNKAADEVYKLITEHINQGGPFNSDLLLEFREVLGDCDRIVILKQE